MRRAFSRACFVTPWSMLKRLYLSFHAQIGSIYCTNWVISIKHSLILTIWVQNRGPKSIFVPTITIWVGSAVCLYPLPGDQPQYIKWPNLCKTFKWTSADQEEAWWYNFPYSPHTFYIQLYSLWDAVQGPNHILSHWKSWFGSHLYKHD